MTAPGGLDLSGLLLLAALALGAAFFVVRPEVWGRLFLAPMDPRPIALMRIAFGSVVLWTFVALGPLVRFLYTDEGLWLTEIARARYGAPLGSLGSLSLLHVRSDPPVVFALYAALLVCVLLMTLGAWTTWTTAVSWLLVVQFYGYTPASLFGADRAVHAFLFLGMFSAWGEAYSIDSWRARRREVLGGAATLPARPGIPAWPARLMALQLALIYCSSGLPKTGITWRDGSALYYVLNGDHLYRVPAQAAVTWLHHIGVLPLLTWLTRWWEMLFPLVLAGVALQAYESDRRAGRWPAVGRGRQLASWALAAGAWCAIAAIVGVAGARAAPGSRWLLGAGIATAVVLSLGVAIPLYRLVRDRWPSAHRVLLHWVLGRRTWLGFGVLFHLGIEAGTNLGTFPAVMVATYFAWLTGPAVDRLVGFVFSRAVPPGHAGRPARPTWWARVLHGLADRLRHRAPSRPVAIRYHPDEGGIRRAALVRLLAAPACDAFVPDPALPPETIRVEAPRIDRAGVFGACCRAVLRAVGRL